MRSWPEGMRLAAQMQFRFPQFVPTPMSQVIPNASPEGGWEDQDLTRVTTTNTFISHHSYYHLISAPSYYHLTHTLLTTVTLTYVSYITRRIGTHAGSDEV